MTTRRKSAREAVAQTLGGAVPSSRAGADWGARARSTILDAQRYTRFVAIMKRALLVATAAVILAVLIYSVLPRQSDELEFTFQRMGTVDNDLAMIKPRLTGSDSQGNPFVITADSAVQLGRNQRRAKLNNMEGDITLGDGGWITMTATTGLLDAGPAPQSDKKSRPRGQHGSEKGTLDLHGQVSVFSDSGYEIHTDYAHLDLGTGIVDGPHPVAGQGPLGTMRADRFRMVRDVAPEAGTPGSKHVGTSRKGKIYLIGHVYMTFYATHGTKKK